VPPRGVDSRGDPLNAERVEEIIAGLDRGDVRVAEPDGDGWRVNGDAQEAILEIMGADPRPWFRCPFGEGSDDPRIHAGLEKLGYRNVHWHVVLEDWEPWRDGPAIAADAIAGARAHGDGAVILLHTWPGGTGEAVPVILEGLREAGARFVGIDQLETVP